MNKKSLLLSSVAAFLLFMAAGCSNNGTDSYDNNDTTVTEQPAPAPANDIDTFHNPDSTMTDTGM